MFLLMMTTGVDLVSICAAIFSLIVIIASIRWIRDINKMKKDKDGERF